ncbi:MAG: thiol:disulfide interchange protein DsbA/DsbL [Comamonas sp.]
MKRRDFSLTAASVAAASLALPTQGALAQAKFQEGKDYVKLRTPVTPEAPAGKVDVIEFFWYSCPHCNAFEPQFEAWVKGAPKHIQVRRVPIAFNNTFIPQQKIYFALEAMGKIPEVHEKVFRAIHVERQRLNKDDEIFAFMEKQGVDGAKFKEVYNSFSVASQVRKATQLQEAYGVEGVPAMGVAGKYYTDGTRAGSMANVLKVVEYLAAQSKA